MAFTVIPRPGASSFSQVPRPGASSFTSVSEILDDILDESGSPILDELSGKLNSEQKVGVFTTIPRPI